MRILLVNSNTSEAVTRLVREEAERSADPDVEIAAVTARFGARAIETRSDVAIAGHATLDAFAAYGAGAGAGIIACFSDPGLSAVRQLMPFPVVGIAEAACFTACMIGARFSIIVVGAQFETPIRELVAGYGLAGRLASVRALDRSVADVGAAPAAVAPAVAELIERAALEDRAEVAVLGGAVTAGLTQNFGRAPSIPVVDGVGAAVRQATLLARLRLPSAAAKRASPGGTHVGVSDELSKMLQQRRNP